MKPCDHTYKLLKKEDYTFLTELLHPRDECIKSFFQCTKCLHRKTQLKYQYHQPKPERSRDMTLLSSAHNHPDNPRKCIRCNKYFPSELRVDCIRNEAREEAFCRDCYWKEMKR